VNSSNQTNQSCIKLFFLPETKMSVNNALCLLEGYSSCDISDALNALKLSPGHIPNLNITSSTKLVCPAYTCEFGFANLNAPKAKVHHVDSCPSGHILIIKSPSTAPNAVWGGLMTARAKAVGCKGAIIDGLIRDSSEIRDMEFPVWARGRSTMGAAPICKVVSVGEDIILNGNTPWPVCIRTGDIVVADEDGAVVLSIERVQEVADYCAKRTAIDQRCMEDIKNGSTIVEAFAKHREK
jgi:regulator of RNase E activity RraA